MAIFNSYVSLPEGISKYIGFNGGLMGFKGDLMGLMVSYSGLTWFNGGLVWINGGLLKRMKGFLETAKFPAASWLVRGDVLWM